MNGLRNNIINKLQNINEIPDYEINELMLEIIEETGIFIKFKELDEILPRYQNDNIYRIIKSKIKNDYPLNENLNESEIKDIRQHAIEEYQLLIAKNLNGKFIFQEAKRKNDGSLEVINTTEINTDKMKNLMLEIIEDAEKRFQFSNLSEDEEKDAIRLLKLVKTKLKAQDLEKIIKKQDIFEIAKLQLKEDVEEMKYILKKEIWGAY